MDLKPVVPVATAGCRRQGKAAGLLAVALIAAVLLLPVVSPAEAAASNFPDVPSSHPYFAAITDLATRDIIGGYATGDFGPNDPVSRQQFAKMIVLAGAFPVSETDVCPFTDVVKGGAATLFPDNYVAVCAAQGITTGVTLSLFAPYNSITRFQVTSMVVRAADTLHPGLLVAPPGGWSGSAAWAKDPTHRANALRAQYNGLFSGLDPAALDPYEPMTRGEVAQMLHNLVVKLGIPLPPVDVTLSVSVTEGSGSIVLDPDQTTFSPGEAVTLRAVPASGFAFAGWGGDIGGFDNVLTVTMDSDRSVTATFIATSLAMPQSFENLGGFLTSAPTACSQGHELLDVFARGTAGSVVHTSWDGTAWSGWEDLGGSVKPGSGPAAVSWGRDRLDVFIRDTDDALWHKWWDGSAWSEWESLGGSFVSGPAAAYRDFGQGQDFLDVFAVESGGQLKRRTFDGTDWGPWTAAGRSGSTLNPSLLAGSSPVAVTWGRQRIDLFVTGSDGLLWRCFLPPTGEWSMWESLGSGVTSGPAASTWASWAEGRQDVFVRGLDGGLRQRTVVSALWSAWKDLGVGVVTSAPAAVSWGPGRIDLFVRGIDGALWHKAWTGSAWVP